MMPDKICVAPHQIIDDDLDIQEVGHNGAEEYLRKDALLEWAKEKKTRLEKIFDAIPATAVGAKLDICNELINKLNSI